MPDSPRSQLRTLLRTGCGKDASISRPVTLFAHSQLERLIGPGEWKSDSGLRAALIDHPSHVCFIDEFTKVLKVLSGDRIPPHLAGIKRYLLGLFSRAGSVHMAPGYADRKLNAPIHLNEPNLCLYGTGTPDDLFAALRPRRGGRWIPRALPLLHGRRRRAATDASPAERRATARARRSGAGARPAPARAAGTAS